MFKQIDILIDIYLDKMINGRYKKRSDIYMEGKYVDRSIKSQIYAIHGGIDKWIVNYVHVQGVHFNFEMKTKMIKSIHVKYKQVNGQMGRLYITRYIV